MHLITLLSLFLLFSVAVFAQPTPDPRCTIDLVVVADTSGSMLNDLEGLCTVVELVFQDLQDNNNITSNLVVYGIAEPIPLARIPSCQALANRGGVILRDLPTYASANGLTTELYSDACYPDPGASDLEEAWIWGSAFLCEYHDWGLGARVLIPLSDEDPCFGDPCDPVEAQAAADRALPILLEGGCGFNPLIPDDSNINSFECIQVVGTQLARATNSLIFAVPQEDPELLADALAESLGAIALQGCFPTDPPTTSPPTTTPPTTSPPTTSAPSAPPTTVPPTTAAPPMMIPKLVCADGEACDCDEDQSIFLSEEAAVHACYGECRRRYAFDCPDFYEVEDIVMSYDCETTVTEKCTKSLCASGYYFSAESECACTCASCDCDVVM